MTSEPVLEPAARQFADATASPPFLFDLGPEKGREAVDQVQSGDIAKPDVDVSDTTVPGGPSGAVSVRILRPRDATGPLPVIVYIHGAGWVMVIGATTLIVIAAATAPGSTSCVGPSGHTTAALLTSSSTGPSSPASRSRALRVWPA
jgi:acetyl esterase/lipase